MYRARDIMVAPVVTARPETPVNEVIREMVRGTFTGLPVVDEHEEITGIITQFDILRAIENGKDINNLTASDIMSASPVCVSMNTPIPEIIGLILERGIIRLPVTEDRRVVGIVSRRDIIQSLSKDVRECEDLSFIPETMRTLLSARSHHELLRVLVDKIGEYFDARRCSIIRVDENGEVATVLSTFEDQNISNLRLEMEKYPEIQQAYRTGKPVIINDAQNDPLMKPILHHLKGIDLSSLLVFPIVSDDEVLGTLYLRSSTKRKFSRKEVTMAEILAGMAVDAIEAINKERKLLQSYQEAEKQAVTDELTGLYNRRFFNTRLDEEFQMAQRHDLPLSCIMIDINDFKNINDTHGHDTGDGVLRKFANLVRDSVRRSDILARFGGDEFVLLLPMTDEQGARKEAQRLRGKVNELDCGPPVSRVAISIGVAGTPGQEIESPEDLVKAADAAMYEDKKAAKNGQV